MRTSFDPAFEIVIGLEGKPTNDSKDPGGYTVWGISSKYNVGISKNTTIEEAKKIYYEKYN